MQTGTFYFIKKNGKLEIDNIELYLEWIKHIHDGEKGQMVISNIPKPKSTQQNKTYWHIIDMARQALEDDGIDSSYLYNLSQPTGVPITKSMLHQWTYVMFPQLDEHGNLTQMSSSKWTSAMSSNVIDGLINFFASQFGLVITIENLGD